MSRRKKGSGIKSETFLRLYMESWKAGHTVRQFADRVGVTPSNVHSRVRYYRSRGAKIPNLRSAARFGRKVEPVNIGRLNVIISEAMTGYRTALPDEVRPALTSMNGRSL